MSTLEDREADAHLDCIAEDQARRDEWFCEAHDVTTDGDCWACDNELIALTAEAAGVKCNVCKRTIHVGEDAWASDWKVITAEGVRVEVRYTCDGCEASA